MRRTLSTDDSQAVSLFPFLAVLLSTMGALLLVLVVMARQARLHAGQEERPPDAPVRADEPAAEHEPEIGSADDARELAEATARLQAIRDEGRKELEESYDRLRHADSHLRQLQEEVAALYRQVRALEQLGSHRMADRDQAERELARLRELIRKTEEDLQRQRRRAEATPKSYAIVPYAGPHGTQRRPLYIECRQDKVILQPEGIELGPADFRGPLGPGNALASALRAAEDHYAATAAAGQNERPYPLVLVRPEGIATYYHVRRALEGWGTDFGYELLEGDWQLDLPLPNPQVANAQQKAIDVARARQHALALAAPRQFGGSGGGGSVGGPLEGEEGNGGDGFFGGIGSALPHTVDGNNFADSGNGDNGGNARAPNARYASFPLEGDAGAPSGPDWDNPHRGNPLRGGSGTGRDSTNSAGTNADGGDRPSRATLQANGSEVPGGNLSRSAASPGSKGAGGAAETGTLQPGAAASPLAAGPHVPLGEAAANAGGFSAGSSAEPLAQTRGANWALPQAGSGAVPIRRSIHVIVRQDHLAILPEQGAAGGRTIPLDRSVAESADSFVEAAREHIKTWGTAGRGMYWQPILVLKAGPDGVQNAATLRRLLKGSGLELAPPN